MLQQLTGNATATDAQLRNVWATLADTVIHWPWATIAAFMAVSVTLWVANSESRQRRRQLQQDAILDINFQSTEWINDAGEFLAYVRTYLESAGTTKLPWSLTVLEPVTTTTNTMDRALKSAHMTCNDFGVIRLVSEAELQLARFLTLLNGPHPQDTAGLHTELSTVMIEGQKIQQDFATTTEALINRGFEAYALKKGLKFRVRRRVAIWSQWIKRKIRRQ